MDLALGMTSGAEICLDACERKAMAVVMGEMDGGRWNWSTNEWEKTNDGST